MGPTPNGRSTQQRTRRAFAGAEDGTHYDEDRRDTCGHCVASINNALKSLDAVQVEQVKVGSAAVAFDAARTSTDTIAQAIAEEGYAVVSTETIQAR